MISKVTGIVSYKGTDHILIDVHGIGYEVFVSELTLTKIPTSGDRISIYTELIVREDLLQLVGFSTRHEREWYRLLTGVQGVGSKAALKILGTLQINLLSRSILTGDSTAIKAAPGIGPKIAQRIVVELKDKVASLIALEPEPSFGSEVVKMRNFSDTETFAESNKELEKTIIESSEKFDTYPSHLQPEALSALTNLGYASYDAALALSNVLNDNPKAVDLQELIKLALQNLSPKA